MSSFLEKARSGRVNALANRASGPSHRDVTGGLRLAFTSSKRHEMPAFVSSRRRKYGQDIVL